MAQWIFTMHNLALKKAWLVASISLKPPGLARRTPCSNVLGQVWPASSWSRVSKSRTCPTGRRLAKERERRAHPIWSFLLQFFSDNLASATLKAGCELWSEDEQLSKANSEQNWPGHLCMYGWYNSLFSCSLGQHALEWWTKPKCEHMTNCELAWTKQSRSWMKVKVVKWCQKKWNGPILMYIYHIQCEIIQKDSGIWLIFWNLVEILKFG